MSAELVVGHDARLPTEDGRPGERVASLLEAIDVRRRLRADARQADRAVARAPPGSNARSLATASTPRRATGTSARIASSPRCTIVPGNSADERGLEALVGRLGHQHDVRLLQVAAETCRATVEFRSGPALRELVEEVRDQVPLGQALDQPHLLDPTATCPRSPVRARRAGSRRATISPSSSSSATRGRRRDPAAPGSRAPGRARRAGWSVVQSTRPGRSAAAGGRLRPRSIR